MEEDESLADLFGAAARALRGRQRAELAGFAVAPSQARAMGVLRRHGVMRPSDLAAHLRIAPRSATEVVDDLQARGLVGRHPDPADRRATLVTLTEEGARIAADLRAAQSRAAAGWFARLDEGERADLARLLRALRD